MKIVPYDPMLKPEKTLALKMEGSPTGGVMLRACDPTTGEKINDGILLTVAENGIVRHTDVSDRLGLPLDDDGRVRVKDRRELDARSAKVARVIESLARHHRDDHVVLYGDGLAITVTAGDIRHFISQIMDF